MMVTDKVGCLMAIVAVLEILIFGYLIKFNEEVIRE